MPYHPPFLIGNTSYDLSHLDPATFETSSIKLGRAIMTRCWFTTYTFTEGASDKHQSPILLDEGKRLHVFCPERYAVSHHLPAAVQLLADPDHYVREGVHGRN